MGALRWLVMHAAAHINEHEGKLGMAEEEPLLTSPPTQDAAVHVRDYTRFTTMLKWSAIACLIIALLVVLIIS